MRPPASADEQARRFFALTASEAGTAERVAALLPELLSEEELADLATLLRVLRALGVGRLPWWAVQPLLAGLGAADDEAAQALTDLRQLTTDGNEKFNLRWLPDGDTIAYISSTTAASTRHPTASCGPSSATPDHRAGRSGRRRHSP